AVSGDLASRNGQLQATLSGLNTFLADVRANDAALGDALVNLNDAAGRLKSLVHANDSRIKAEVADLARILGSVNAKRHAIKRVINALPGLAVRIQRVSSYGQWGNQHLISVCKDDKHDCGKRGRP